MFKAHLLSPLWKLSVIVAVVSVANGNFHSALAQGPNWDTKAAAINRPSNPKEDRNNAVRTRAGKSIGEAIAAGNAARDKSDYQQALIQYRKAMGLNPNEARAYYGLGNIYSDLQCNDSAIDAYLSAIRLKKDFPEAHTALGYTYSRNNRYEDAEAEFRLVLNKTPNNSEANIGLGLLFARRERYPEAVDQIRRALDNQDIEKKYHATVSLAVGVVYALQEKHESAIEQFKTAVRLKPDLVNAYLWLGSSQLNLAFSKLLCVVKMSPKDLEELRSLAKQATGHIERGTEIGISNGHDYSPPGLYLRLAEGFTYQQEYDVALRHLKTYSDRVSELEQQVQQLGKGCRTGLDELKAWGHHQEGFVYQFESRFEPDARKKAELRDKAINKAGQALKAKPDFPYAHFMLGNIYDSENKRQEAITEYTKAIVPAFSDVVKASLYYKIGTEHLALDHKDEALENFQEAIRRDPNEPLFYEAAASIYVSQGNLDATFSQLTKAMALREKVKDCAKPDPYYYLGATYAVRFLRAGNEGDFEAAKKWLKRATEISRDYSMAYQALGAIHLRHRNADDALANYEEAIKYDPKDPANYSSKGRVYFELKQNHDAAIESLKKAIDLQSDFAEAHYELALVYRQIYDEAAAIKHLLEAIRPDAKYLIAYLELATIYREQENYSEGVKYLNKAMGFAWTDVRLYKEFAKHYEAQRQNENAIEYYRKAINLLKPEDAFVRDLYLCRIERLQAQYVGAVGCFQKLNLPPTEDPGQIIYDVGLTYVADGQKEAARSQHEKLKELKSSLARDLLRQISKMK